MASFNFTTREIQWRVDTLPNGNTKHTEIGRTFTKWIIAIYPGNNGIISITRDNETRTYKAVEDIEFTYKVQKTQIRAIDGAAGLFRYIDRQVTYQTPRYDYGIIPESCVNVLRLIWDNCRAIA